MQASESASVVSDRPCPLCSAEYKIIHDLQLHVAYHLERLALFSLPKSHHLERETDSVEDRAGSNDANALKESRDDPVDGSKLSFDSNPIQHENLAVGNMEAYDAVAGNATLGMQVEKGADINAQGGEYGKYEQAEEMHRQALGQRERVLGKEHPDTLTSMNNLAEVLRGQGKYEQAEEMHG